MEIFGVGDACDQFFFLLAVHSRVYKVAGRLFVGCLEGIISFVTVSFWLAWSLGVATLAIQPLSSAVVPLAVFQHRSGYL